MIGKNRIFTTAGARNKDGSATRFTIPHPSHRLSLQGKLVVSSVTV